MSFHGREHYQPSFLHWPKSYLMRNTHWQNSIFHLFVCWLPFSAIKSKEFCLLPWAWISYLLGLCPFQTYLCESFLPRCPNIHWHIFFTVSNWFPVQSWLLGIMFHCTTSLSMQINWTKPVIIWFKIDGIRSWTRETIQFKYRLKLIGFKNENLTTVEMFALQPLEISRTSRI